MVVNYLIFSLPFFSSCPLCRWKAQFYGIFFGARAKRVPALPRAHVYFGVFLEGARWCVLVMAKRAWASAFSSESLCFRDLIIYLSVYLFICLSGCIRIIIFILDLLSLCLFIYVYTVYEFISNNLCFKSFYLSIYLILIHLSPRYAAGPHAAPLRGPVQGRAQRLAPLPHRGRGPHEPAQLR